ncbi:hypothetical protein KJ807_05750 [Patescibacteria group bacterium]|nr:hypothetical protein [Patescibacteria group bacterium]
MKKIILIIVLILLPTFTLQGCARAPKKSTAERVILKYYKKYGKKYPETIYGQYPVKEVEVTESHEIHKHMIEATAFITFKNDELKRVSVTIERPNYWWKVVSWEDLARQ